LSYGPPAEVISEEVIRSVYGVEVSVVQDHGEVYVIPIRPVEPEKGDNEDPRPCEKGIVAD
ncbi:MAG: hypothetical protein JXA45_05200, partial [Methanomassiliicoccales archaeon]|nr:hypothetical protein [Methanomassiliicoccales archaeon]